jgi:ferredoxin
VSLVTTSESSFRLNEGETLLQGLERTGHDVQYQCRSGYCGACRLPLQAGCVVYRQAPLAFVGQGEILPCCCVAAGPVSIECRLRQPPCSNGPCLQQVICIHD